MSKLNELTFQKARWYVTMNLIRWPMSMRLFNCCLSLGSGGENAILFTICGGAATTTYFARHSSPLFVRTMASPALVAWVSVNKFCARK